MRKNRVLVAGTVAGALALAAGAAGIASAATGPPPLAFVAATQNVTVERHVFGDQVWLDFDLGVNLIAGRKPFEVRVTRSSYATPITGRQIVVDKGRRTEVPLPAGMVTGFGGLDKFTTVTIRDSAGQTLRQYSPGYCPNSYRSARTRVDAPALNPYPTDCRGVMNPFTLGAVWGIQAGWNSTVSSWPEDAELDLKPGTYAVTVALNPIYRTFFKIPEKDATVDLNVTVVDVVERGPGMPAKATARDEHAAHAGEGDDGRQIAAYRPEFRPPAKRPATLAAAPKTGPRPDLRSLPAWGISLSRTDGKWYVDFGATVWNAGTSPLLVDGFRRTGSELMDAYQYFFDARGRQVGSVPAGTMEWDAREGHRHWHFTDFARYNLLGADSKVVVKSGKEAFCLANTDAVDYTLPYAKWRPENVDLATSCGGNTAVAVREVLDVGGGDTYTQDRPGQSFEITDVPNGTYYIEVRANPEKRLTELSTANNSSLRRIVLGGTPEARTLTVPPVHGIEG